MSANTSVAVLGGGCFWCLEAIFRTISGVIKVENGYAGGRQSNPDYKSVCTGTTGHAEVVRITYDPDTISYENLLKIFWKVHDPTTRNRQGDDIGEQYRSIILYMDEDQKRIAYESIKKASVNFTAPIVTELEALEKFWLAEDYHQDYFRKNPSQAYCRIVIAPKLDKFRDQFKKKLII